MIDHCICYTSTLKTQDEKKKKKKKKKQVATKTFYSSSIRVRSSLEKIHENKKQA